MPLVKGSFDDEAYEKFLFCQKETVARSRVWSLRVYCGWKICRLGGLQCEQGDPDLALVLHPDYWGIGKRIYEEILKRAFGEMGFTSVTVLLPPSRKSSKTLLRYHFKADGEVKIENERFFRFRLHASDIL